MMTIYNNFYGKVTKGAEALYPQGFEAMDYFDQIDAKTSGMWSACLTKEYQKVRDLLYEGADVNYRGNTYRETPLHIAVSRKDTTLLAILLSDPRLKIDMKGGRFLQCPLHVAVEQNNEDMAELLILHGSSPNATDDHENTPLHIVAQFGYNSMNKMLLRHEARCQKNEAGLTPIDVAEEYGYFNICYRLRERSEVQDGDPLAIVKHFRRKGIFGDDSSSSDSDSDISDEEGPQNFMVPHQLTAEKFRQRVNTKLREINQIFEVPSEISDLSLDEYQEFLDERKENEEIYTNAEPTESESNKKRVLLTLRRRAHRRKKREKEEEEKRRRKQEQERTGARPKQRIL